MNLPLYKKALASSCNALSWPYRLNFLMSKECHSRCQNCNIWKVTPSGELTLDEIKSIAQKYPYVAWLGLTGGEPTDRKDIVEIAAAFQKYSPKLSLVNFSTNGLNRARVLQVAERMLALRLPKLVISVSVDGPEEINDEIRGIVGDFKRATETASALFGLRGRLGAEKRFDVFVSMTLYPRNHTLIRQTQESLQSAIPGFSAESFHVNIGSSSYQAYENLTQAPKTLPSESALRDFNRGRKLSLKPSSLLERIFHDASLDYIRTGKSPLPCQALSSSIFLTEKGILYPCSIWNSPLGNLRDHQYDIKTLLRSNEAAEAKRKIKSLDCPNCWSPCEAYQSIAASPAQAAKHLIKSFFPSLR